MREEALPYICKHNRAKYYEVQEKLQKRKKAEHKEESLDYIPTPYQELGYAGENMLNYFLKKMGYDGIKYPETAFSKWMRLCYGNPLNQYVAKIKTRGVDNWIRHPEKGRLAFEVKNFGHKKFGNKSTSKLTCKKVLGTEVMGKFHPHLRRGEQCVLVVSHDEVIPSKAHDLLHSWKIKVIVYDIQVIPNNPKTFKRAIANLYHSQLLYIVRP